MNEIARAIRLARVACGETQLGLARRVGIHVVTLNGIERGRLTPIPGVAEKCLEELQKNAPKSALAVAVLGEAEKVIADAGSEANGN